MNESRERLIDRFGATASTLCAIHCAICALLPAAFAAIGLGVLLSHNVENLLALVAILFGAAAMRLASTTHRSTTVTTMLALGIVGMIGARGLELSSSHEHHGGEAHAAHHDDQHHGEDDDHHGEDDDHHGEDDDHHGEDDDHHGEGDDHHGEEDHHGHDDGGLHLAGSSLGITAGLMLAMGHLLNLRAVARCREECCNVETEVS